MEYFEVSEDIKEIESAKEQNESADKGSTNTSISKHPATKALLFPVVNAVFQPSAEVLGSELKGWVENRISEKKRARIQKHTEKAKTDSNVLQNPEIKSERQLSNLILPS